MAHHRHLPLAVAATFAAAVVLLVPRAAGYPWPVCGDDKSSFKPNSTYQSNLAVLAATLPKKASASPTLYATAAVGTIPNQVWAVALCRGDTNASVCLTCLAQAFKDLPNDCSYDKDGTIYYDPCILYYSDVRTLAAGGSGGDDTGPAMDTYVVNNNANVTSDPARFRALLRELVNATAERAASGDDSPRRFATGEADFDDREFPKVYALAQCTPDKTPEQCRKCLAGIVASDLGVFGNNIGGRVLGVDCNFRYETAPFFNGQAMVRLAVSGKGGRKYRVFALVLAVVLPTLAALNLVFCLCLWRPGAEPGFNHRRGRDTRIK